MPFGDPKGKRPARFQSVIFHGEKELTARFASMQSGVVRTAKAPSLVIVHTRSEEHGQQAKGALRHALAFHLSVYGGCQTMLRKTVAALIVATVCISTAHAQDIASDKDDHILAAFIRYNL